MCPSSSFPRSFRRTKEIRSDTHFSTNSLFCNKGFSKLALFKTHYKSKIHGDLNLPKIIDIEAKAFDETIKRSDIPVVLEFWIRSCGFCQKFKPVYDQLPDIYGGQVSFLRMNMMKSIENLRLAEGLGVEKTPTMKVFCKGGEVGELLGYKPLDKAVYELNAILQSKEDCRP